jgi:hypothetical protein
MSAEGGHLGWKSGSLDTILKIDHLRTIHAMFALNWLTGFREEDFEVCCLYKTIWDSYRLGKKIIMFIKNQRLPGACNRSPGSSCLKPFAQ